MAWWQLSSRKQYSNSNIKDIIYVTKKFLIDNMLPSYRREIHSSAICRYYWPSAHHCGSLMKQSYQKMQRRHGPFLGSHQCASFWHGWKSIRSNISAPCCRAKKMKGKADTSFISTNYTFNKLVCVVFCIHHVFRHQVKSFNFNRLKTFLSPIKKLKFESCKSTGFHPHTNHFKLSCALLHDKFLSFTIIDLSRR